MRTAVLSIMQFARIETILKYNFHLDLPVSAMTSKALTFYSTERKARVGVPITSLQLPSYLMAMTPESWLTMIA